MAEDLGTIDISVKSDSQQIEKSFEDGGDKAGKRIGDALSRILGTFAGGLGHATGQAVGAGISVFGMPGSKRALPGSTPLTVGGKAVGVGRGAGMARLLPMLGKIGLIVGAVALLGVAIKKVIGSMINFTKRVENMSHRFAGLNATLALLSAQKRV